jgi:hypothetical protein
MASEQRNIPIVNTAAERRLIGSLSRAQVLAKFSEAIAEKSQPTPLEKTAPTAST